MKAVKRPLRIGILLRNRHDGPGGLEKVLSMVVEHMPKAEVEFYFYALYPLKYDAFTQNFKSCFYLPRSQSWIFFQKFIPKKIFRVVQKYNVQKNGMQLFDRMISDQLDLLITMDLSKQFLGNYTLLKAFKDKANIPIISWVHSSLSTNSPEIIKAVKEKINLFDGHLAISKGIAEELEKDYQARNIQVVYNPVLSAEIIERDSRKFLYIGRIDANKRVDSLLLQLKKLTGEWSLDIYGSTGKKKKDKDFIDLISKLGLSGKVVFHGWKEDVWSEIKSAGVLLLNSEREAFGMVVIEAMQRGIPVVAAAGLGPQDLILSGKNGWLYPINEEEKICSILEKFLDNNVFLDPKVIQNSVRHFEVNYYNESFLRIIRDMCHKS